MRTPFRVAKIVTEEYGPLVLLASCFLSSNDDGQWFGSHKHRTMRLRRSNCIQECDIGNLTLVIRVTPTMNIQIPFGLTFTSNLPEAAVLAFHNQGSDELLCDFLRTSALAAVRVVLAGGVITGSDRSKELIRRVFE
jgi:hypothetical protein